VFNFDKVLHLILAFIAFSLTASSVYLVNDLLDLDSDRKHHRKRHRPLASGAMPIPVGIGLTGLFLAGAAGTALLLSPGFQLLLLLYLAVTTAYSVSLKRKLLIDVMVLAGLYTLRIFAGGEAADIVVSPWLLMLSMFLFTSLAFLKRFTEIKLNDARLLERKLQGISAEPRSGQVAGRGYRSEDAALVGTIGPVCGVVAVLVLAMYISSDVAQKSYSHPLLLWGICPIALYWISRIWFLGNRGKVHDDPVVFAIRDRASWLTAACVATLAVLATW
jgi:4-hydroxybenzoate polyprenyltransferase